MHLAKLTRVGFQVHDWDSFHIKEKESIARVSNEEWCQGFGPCVARSRTDAQNQLSMPEFVRHFQSTGMRI